MPWECDVDADLPALIVSRDFGGVGGGGASGAALLAVAYMGSGLFLLSFDALIINLPNDGPVPSIAVVGGTFSATASVFVWTDTVVAVLFDSFNDSTLPTSLSIVAPFGAEFDPDYRDAAYPQGQEVILS